MITSRTKKQLIVFAIITLLGVTFVGARYARLDRLFYDSAYAVDAHFAQSGGIFTGAEVTYRGVTIGRVSKMKLTDKGVDVILSINKSEDKIPTDSLALVGNKSAVGEQYVELQPQTDNGPYLKDGSDDRHPGHRDPGVDDRDPDQPRQPRPVGPAGRPAHGRRRVRCCLQRRWSEPGPDHRHLELVHQDRRGQLRDHHRPDPRLPRGAADPGRQGLGHPQLHQEPRAVLRHGRRQRQVPPLADRQRLGHRQRAALVPGAEQGQPRPAAEQPGHHQRDRGQAPQGDPPDPGDLPLRRRRRLHGRGEVREQLQRPVRPDPDPGLGRLREGLRGLRPPLGPEHRRPADEDQRRVHGPDARTTVVPRSPRGAAPARRTAHRWPRTMPALARSSGPTRTLARRSPTTVAPPTCSARTPGSGCSCSRRLPATRSSNP